MADIGIAAGGDLKAAHVQHAAPIGVIFPYAGPSGTASVICITGSGTATGAWLHCTGSAVSRTTYADLFSVIGTAFGVGDNSTTFNLPDLRGRVPLGAGTGQGTATGVSVNTGTPTGGALTARVIGNWGGTEASVHSHGITNIVGKTDGPDSKPPTSTDNTQTFKLQPFLTINFIIRATYY